MNAPEKIYYTIGMGGFPQLALEPDGRWTTEYIRADIHDEDLREARRERDETLQNGMDMLGCDCHSGISFEQFVAAGSFGCPLCLRAEREELDRQLADLQRQIDEACAVTESCPTLQHMIGAVIEGAQLKDQLAQAQERERALIETLDRVVWDAVNNIRITAHNASTGPAVHDEYWTIRSMCDSLHATITEAVESTELPPDPRDAEIQRLKQRVENEQDQREAATLQTLLMTHFQACRPAYPAGLYGWATAALAGSTAPGAKASDWDAGRDLQPVTAKQGESQPEKETGRWHCNACQGRTDLKAWQLSQEDGLPLPTTPCPHCRSLGTLGNFEPPEKEAGEWREFVPSAENPVREGDQATDWSDSTKFWPVSHSIGLTKAAGRKFRRRWHRADSGKEGA